MKHVDTISVAINRTIGYLSTLSAASLLFYYLMFRRIKRLLKWVIILAAIGAICMFRYLGYLQSLM